MAVTLLAEVPNTNPVGAFKITVPLWISPTEFSVIIGPVSDVKGPPTVFDGIAFPPAAGVTTTAAKTFPTLAKNKIVIATTKKAILL